MTSMKTKLRRKQGRKRTGPPFVQLYKYMLRCPAWLALSATAQAAYVRLALRYDGVNNGMLALSVRGLAQELNCDKATASRALRELEDAGFIECVKIGSFTRRNRKASEYRLTAFRCDVTGELPTKKFMRIKDTIGELPTLKPWEAEGIGRSTWYRRQQAKVGRPTVRKKESHGCIGTSQIPNGTPTVAPDVPSASRGTNDGCTGRTLIESNHGGGTGTGTAVPQPDAKPVSLRRGRRV
jgi:MarR family